MFNDLPVRVEAKDVDARPIAIAWPLLIAMQHHVVAFGDYAFEFDAFPGYSRAIRSK
jgi:hypothetical protein